jgi:hypothetical protein
MKTIAFSLGKVTISSVSRKDWEYMQKNAIKKWHFERSIDGSGVVPVVGEFDKSNLKHVGKRV